MPKKSDIKKIIRFYENTKSEADGYTVHCWRGIARSTATALGLLYLIHGDEIKAYKSLKKIRPEARPHRQMVKWFDEILGSKLDYHANLMYRQFDIKYLEDLEPVVGLEIQLQKIDSVKDCLIIYLKGYIDLYNFDNFIRRVHLFYKAGYKCFIFNCDGIDHISSAGTFHSVEKLIYRNGGKMVFVGKRPKVLQDNSGMFLFKDNLDEAVDFFKGIENQLKSSFPKYFLCPACGLNIKATKPGHFRCRECKIILDIDNIGRVIHH